jgi:glycosyltransferase involved in cell wall biosynthesis
VLEPRGTRWVFLRSSGLGLRSGSKPSLLLNVACNLRRVGRGSIARSRLHFVGYVTAVASPQETAEAIVSIAKDPKLHDAMARTAMERVERFYREEDLNRTYLGIYNALMQKKEDSN